MRTALNLAQNDDDIQLMDDPTLLKQAMVRVAEVQDRDSFKFLFSYFAPRVKAVLLKAGSNESQAEDLMQDVMMTVWRKARLYAPDRGSVNAWVFTVARNARIDLLRRASSRPYDDVYEIEMESDVASGEDEMFATERAERVSEALSDLPEEQRQIIELGFIEDMSQSEIAEKLDLPLGTVKSRMRLAYGKMKSKLEAVR